MLDKTIPNEEQGIETCFKSKFYMCLHFLSFKSTKAIPVLTVH